MVRRTGLRLREQEHEAERLGAYAHPSRMFVRVEPDGLRWADGRFEPVDAILWATGFRAALDHLAPLRLREPGGGIRIGSEGPALGVPTTVLGDPRVQLVGYGPSASTIGANRAGTGRRPGRPGATRRGGTGSRGLTRHRRPLLVGIQAWNGCGDAPIGVVP